MIDDGRLRRKKEKTLERITGLGEKL